MNDMIPTKQLPVGIEAAVRAKVELELAFDAARSSPRDYDQIKRRIAGCARSPLWIEGEDDGRRYLYTRGRTQVFGLSAPFVREMANILSSIRTGQRIISNDGKEVHIGGWAHDLRENNYREFEDKFKCLIQRVNKQTKITEWVTPDERDLRELINRRAAILIRNATLALIPFDLAAHARSIVQERPAVNPIADPKASESCVAAFEKIGVQAEQLEKKMELTRDQWTIQHIMDMRAIYKSIMDGLTTANEEFEVEAAPAVVPTSAGIAEALRARRTPAHEPKTQQPEEVGT